jgi:7-carboxy-7-deazaguanine synthase
MKVHEIFESISGEAGIFPQGTWCTFIRFQGCNLRCAYCDTKKTQNSAGESTALMDIVDRMKTKHITITGGEPLLQPESELEHLIRILSRRGHVIQVESNGSIPPMRGAPCGWVLDYKGPSSKMTVKMPSVKEFVKGMEGVDAVVKFVIARDDDGQDLFYACNKALEMYDHGYLGKFIFSPLDGDPRTIQYMMPGIRSFLPRHMMDRLIISVQIHKLCEMP